MLACPVLCSYGFKFDNWGANPSTTIGTSVTPGASNAEGSWTQLASGANVAQDCYWIVLHVHGGGTSATIKDQLLDIGVDNAGGSSYTAIISNIICGESAGLSSLAPVREYMFPYFIKAGSSVAGRIQGAAGTAGTVRVGIKLFGQPSAPEMQPIGQYSETIGTIASSAGVSFTPGNAADGTWASLGTTSQDMWWWQLGYQVSNTVITAITTYIDLAYGDATNKITIQRQMHLGSTSELIGDRMGANMNAAECTCYVPGGSTLYVRGRAQSAPDTGFNAVAIGVGG